MAFVKKIIFFALMMILVCNVVYADVIDFNTPIRNVELKYTQSYWIVFGGLFIIGMLLDICFLVCTYKKMRKEEESKNA